MIEDLVKAWQEGSDEERQLLGLTLQAIKQKRERNSAYLSGFMGLAGKFVDENTYQFIVPITPFMYNPLGILHGGITATLMDSTMGSMINKTLEKGQYAVTTDLTVHFIRPGKTGTIRSEASLLHRGRSSALLAANIYDERNRLLAHGTGTFRILGDAAANG